MSLPGVINAFQTGVYQVTRRSSGDYDERGMYQEGLPCAFTVEASIQPSSGREMQVLPESYHGEEVRLVYTKTPLRAVEGSDNPAGDPIASDVIDIDGANWTVVKVKQWPQHCEAWVSRRVP